MNKELEFPKNENSMGKRKNETPAKVKTIHKVLSKYTSVDRSLDNGIHESIVFLFNLSAPPAFKVLKQQCFMRKVIEA